MAFLVKFSGTNWVGFESPMKAPGGLHVRTYDSHLAQMKELGFDVIRLPFAGETLRTSPSQEFVTANKDLWGKSSLEVMDRIVNSAGRHGIKIILDYHKNHISGTNKPGVWFDDSTPESIWLNNWATLAQRYKGNPTVIGADLFNEPHPNYPDDSFPGAFPQGAPFWEEDAGPNEKYNFRRAALAAIDVIHKIEPNWIIWIEGMWHGPYWWGGNLEKVWEAPITKPAGKVAYSSHDYGPYVAELPWHFAPDFPGNLRPLMKKKWGFLVEEGKGPLWVGEFGSFYPPPDTDKNRRERAVFEEQVKYIGKLGASWTIFNWGPDSRDTGGILSSDWTTIEQKKYELLKPIIWKEFGAKK